MDIISKTTEGKEFIYSKKHTILCSSEKQANKLAQHLNENNETTEGIFKLKENEKWQSYKIDKYDNEPKYKLKQSKNRISLIEL